MDPLVTAGELQTYLQRPVDPIVGDLAVAGASGAVRAYCGWDISLTADTITVDGSATGMLNLPTLLLLDVTEIRLDGVVVDPTSYQWTRRGQVFSTTVWPAFSRIDVDCTSGYDPVPDVVRIVALSKAALYYVNPDNVKVAQAGSVSRTFFDLTALDMSLLDGFRLS